MDTREPKEEPRRKKKPVAAASGEPGAAKAVTSKAAKPRSGKAGASADPVPSVSVAAAPAAAPPPASSSPQPSIDRQSSIAELAYRHAERRGFVPGYELEDWLAAEAEVDSKIIGR